MLTRLRHRVQGQEGFTLIELLVVILIIGILAAVAIPAFLNQRGKAQDANVKSDINTAQTAEETYSTNNGAGSYIAASGTASSNPLIAIESTLTPAFAAPESLQVSTSTTSLGSATSPTDPTGSTSSPVTYSIQATSPSKVVYYLTKYQDGGVSRTCSTAGASNASGCSLPTSGGTSGTWGS